MTPLETTVEPNDWIDRLDGRQMLGLLLGISLAIKISIWMLSPVITSDGPVYISQAEEFLRGNWNKGLALNNNLFFYPLLIAGLGSAGMDLVTAGQSLSLVFSVTTVIPLFLLTRRLFNPRVAWWAALAFAVSPAFNEYAVYVMRDPGFLFMFGWAGYYALRALSEENFKSFLLFLLFAFFSFLFRIEGFFLPVFVFLFIIGQVALRRTGSSIFLKKLLIFFVVTSLGAGLLSQVFSDGFRRFNRLGTIVSMLKTPLAKGIFSYDPQVEIQLRKMEDVLPRGNVDNDFAEIARENVRTIYFIGLLENLKRVLYPGFFVACVLGLASFRKYRNTHALFLCQILGYIFVLYLYLLHRSFIETRYVYAPVFLLLPWVGYGIDRGMYFLQNVSRLPRFLPWVLVATLFSIPAVEAATEVKRQFVSAKQAGEWLAERPAINVGPIISTHRETPFYAGRGMQYISTSTKDPDQLASLAKRSNAQLITLLRRHGEEPADLQIEHFTLEQKFTDKRYDTFIFRKQDETSGN